MVRETRRSYLAGAAGLTAGALASLSGCIGVIEDTIEQGDESDSTADDSSLQAMQWLTPPAPDGHGYRFAYWDREALTDASGAELHPEGLVREWPTVTRGNFDRVLWGDPEEMEQFLLLTKPIYSFAYGDHPSRAIRFNSAQVIWGTDAYHDAAESELADDYWEHQTTYEGFDVYTEGPRHAVASGEVNGTSVLVRSNFYRIDEQPGVETVRRMIDARLGKQPQLGETDDAAARLQEQLSGALRIGTAGTAQRFERLAEPIDRDGTVPQVETAGISVDVDGDDVTCELVLATEDTVEDPTAVAERIPALDDWDGIEASAVDRCLVCRTDVPTASLTAAPSRRDHPEAEFEVTFEARQSGYDVTVEHVDGWSIPVEELVVFQERQTESGSWLTRIAPWADHADVETVAVGDRMTAAVPDKLRGGICGVTWGPWSDSSQFSLDHERVDEASIPE